MLLVHTENTFTTSSLPIDLTIDLLQTAIDGIKNSVAVKGGPDDIFVGGDVNKSKGVN